MMKTEDLLKKGINNLSIRKTIKPQKKHHNSGASFG